MNANSNREPLWARLLDAASGGIDVVGCVGEILGFLGEVAVTILSALLEILSGL